MKTPAPVVETGRALVGGGLLGGARLKHNALDSTRSPGRGQRSSRRGMPPTGGARVRRHGRWVSHARNCALWLSGVTGGQNASILVAVGFRASLNSVDDAWFCVVERWRGRKSHNSHPVTRSPQFRWHSGIGHQNCERFPRGLRKKSYIGCVTSPNASKIMKKSGVGRNGYPSGRTGAADRDFYIQAGRAAKAQREASNLRSQQSNVSKAKPSSLASSSKGLFGRLFGG